MTRRLQSTLIILIIISVLGFDLLTPLSANAQEATSVSTALIGGLSCSVGGVLSDWLTTKISEGVSKVADWLWEKGFKSLGFALVNATVPINNPADDTRVTVLDIAARCFAREIMNDLTARITGAVRTSGRENRPGASDPSFVRDWRRFLTNAQHRGENIFRATLNSTVLCPQFSSPLKTLFQANNQPNINNFDTRVGNLSSFQSRAQCSMPAGWTAQNYQNDFAGNGGWDALTRLSQPENNFYGALLLSMSEVAIQRGLEQLSDEKEAVAGKGFTSRRAESIISVITGQPTPLSHCSQDTQRVCTSNSDCATGVCVADPVQNQTKSRCRLYATNGKCIVYNDILTPGSVIGDAFNSTIAEELGWITNVTKWNQLIQYVMTTLMSRVLNLSEPSTYNQESFAEEEYPSPYDRNFNDGNFGNGSIPPPPPGGPQCNDGQDNDGDGSVDFPADLGCVDLLDDDESTAPTPETQGRFCTDVNFGGSCWTLGVGNYTVPVNNSIPAGSFSLPIPNDSMSSALIPVGFEADICSDANYGSCYTITGRSYDSSIGTSGNGVPGDWPGANDTTSSIRIRSTTGPTPTPTPGPTPAPAVTNCSANGSCLTVQYFPLGQNTNCTDNCLVINYQIAENDITGGYSTGLAQIYLGSAQVGPFSGISGSALASGTFIFSMPSPTPATYNITLYDGITLTTEIVRVTMPIP